MVKSPPRTGPTARSIWPTTVRPGPLATGLAQLDPDRWIEPDQAIFVAANGIQEAQRELLGVPAG
ncbi:hypothetical protein PWG15_15620 [Ensifer adhaerens]|uniref:hypothetical protein n=1 Tax=Ensifer adhaerens TaxID=106592 RepID=UPI0023A98E2B|nr:hypothetical protein [Ensifer adhaerens]WDZ76024.1 hypothetical protein PWG15_15620 [Ensifer adhaerens]